MISSLKKLRPLSKGDAVGVFSTASPVSRPNLEEGLAGMRALGFRPLMPADPSNHYDDRGAGFGSNLLDVRINTFHELLADSETSALFAARGGYGTAEVLPHIDFSIIGQVSKPVVGFSDLTSLLLNIPFKAGLPAIHGPMVADGFRRYHESEQDRDSVDQLISLLSDPNFRPSYYGQSMRLGVAEGPILAANLTVLQTMLGTPYMVDLSGTILILEDITERPYRLHRALLQLTHAGAFDRIAGVGFGHFTSCAASVGPDVDFVIQDFVRTMTAHLKFPVITGLPVGHESANLPVPLGCRAKISEGRIELLESPISDLLVS